MPLDSRATQTTATNSATYLVNKRRRVFGTEISVGTGDCAIFPVACGRGVKSRFMRSRILIPATLPGRAELCRVDALPPHDAEWVRSDGHWHHSITPLVGASGAGAQSRPTKSRPIAFAVPADGDQLENGGLIDRSGTPEDAAHASDAIGLD